jgi:hypothetical protein
VVEHYLDTVGVTGSNPVSRTISTSRGDFQSSLIARQIERYLLACGGWVAGRNLSLVFGILRPLNF